jgi:hypothetical protein
VCAFQPLAAGDSAEVRYTGWLEAGGAEGNVFDSNMKKEKALRFRIGKGKVIRGTSTQRPLIQSDKQTHTHMHTCTRTRTRTRTRTSVSHISVCVVVSVCVRESACLWARQTALCG